MIDTSIEMQDFDDVCAKHSANTQQKATQTIDELVSKYHAESLHIIETELTSFLNKNRRTRIIPNRLNYFLGEILKIRRNRLKQEINLKFDDLVLNAIDLDNEQNIRANLEHRHNQLIGSVDTLFTTTFKCLCDNNEKRLCELNSEISKFNSIVKNLTDFNSDTESDAQSRLVSAYAKHVPRKCHSDNEVYTANRFRRTSRPPCLDSNDDYSDCSTSVPMNDNSISSTSSGDECCLNILNDTTSDHRNSQNRLNGSKKVNRNLPRKHLGMLLSC